MVSEPYAQAKLGTEYRRRQCRREGHPMPTSPLWDHVTTGTCLNCGETWTREPVVRGAEDLLGDELHGMAVQLSFEGWWARRCERDRYIAALRSLGLAWAGLE